MIDLTNYIIDKFVNEQRVDESISYLTASLLLIASMFCIPNAGGLVYQLIKGGVNNINKNRIMKELPEISEREKHKLMEFVSNLQYSDLNEYAKELIDNMNKTNDYNVFVENLEKLYSWLLQFGKLSSVELDNLYTIYTDNVNNRKTLNSKLNLHWIISPLEFIDMMASDSSHSHRHRSKSSGGLFGGGRSGGGGYSARW